MTDAETVTVLQSRLKVASDALSVIRGCYAHRSTATETLDLIEYVAIEALDKLAPARCK